MKKEYKVVIVIHIDFKRLAIKIGHQVTAMNDVEFKDGPWAREYLT